MRAVFKASLSFAFRTALRTTSDFEVFHFSASIAKESRVSVSRDMLVLFRGGE
jgi:hypothetical protein